MYFALAAKTSSCDIFNIHKMLSRDFLRNLQFGQEEEQADPRQLRGTTNSLPSLQALLIILWVQVLVRSRT